MQNDVSVIAEFVVKECKYSLKKIKDMLVEISREESPILDRISKTLSSKSLVRPIAYDAVVRNNFIANVEILLNEQKKTIFPWAGRIFRMTPGEFPNLQSCLLNHKKGICK
jgi:hypothetical protein